MFTVEEPDKPFCKTNWKWEAGLYALLVLSLLSYIGYIYLFANKSPLLTEIRSKSKKVPTPQSKQDEADLLVALKTNPLSPIERMFFRSVVNIKGLPKSGSETGFIDLGSGIMLEEHGYVLTNYHLVKDATKFQVSVFNAKMHAETYVAEIIQGNPVNDLALMKIVSRKVFTPIYVGKSNPVYVGEPVYTIGNPYGAGIGINQAEIVEPSQTLLVNDKDYESLIILNGAISWENSGGPLINSKGEAVGINTAIYSLNGQPVSAAIPINEALNVFKDIIGQGFNIPSMASATTAVGSLSNSPLEVYQWVALFLLGLCSGVMTGMLSMGGGVILVSGLIYFFHYGLVLIRPIAYLSNFFTSGGSAYKYLRSGTLDLQKITYLVPAAFFGMFLGYFVGKVLGMVLIQKILGAFAFFTSIVLLYEVFNNNNKGQGKDERQDEGSPTLKNAYLLGVPMGFFSGVLGISGGVVEVPLQKAIMKVPMKKAIANASGIVFLTSIFGTFLSLGDGAITGSFDWQFPVLVAIFVIPGSIIGGQLGAYLTLKIPTQIVKLVFSIVMLAISFMIFFR
jgi:uncharacterized membrane protein YfcA/S1-C subfamily serine protease